MTARDSMLVLHHHPMTRAAGFFAATSFALTAAALYALATLWPDTSGTYDVATIEIQAAQAQAVCAAGILLVAACVCAVGATVANRPAAPRG